ncbi:MAG TPA: DUF397 domain-containing protein [Streptosporangiaceae bacterium]|nr:DUF397 domain-containing protein [Streptosporangiaceae bacterium]
MNLEWHKSSYSGAQNNCVEVAPLREGAAVRDSKDSEGPVLRFSADAWRAFLGALKSGSIRA